MSNSNNQSNGGGGGPGANPPPKDIKDQADDIENMLV
jgi:hypothetical protein